MSGYGRPDSRWACGGDPAMHNDNPKRPDGTDNRMPRTRAPAPAKRQDETGFACLRPRTILIGVVTTSAEGIDGFYHSRVGFVYAASSVMPTDNWPRGTP